MKKQLNKKEFSLRSENIRNKVSSPHMADGGKYVQQDQSEEMEGILFPPENQYDDSDGHYAHEHSDHGDLPDDRVSSGKGCSA